MRDRMIGRLYRPRGWLQGRYRAEEGGAWGIECLRGYIGPEVGCREDTEHKEEGGAWWIEWLEGYIDPEVGSREDTEHKEEGGAWGIEWLGDYTVYRPRDWLHVSYLKVFTTSQLTSKTQPTGMVPSNIYCKQLTMHVYKMFPKHNVYTLRPGMPVKSQTTSENTC